MWFWFLNIYLFIFNSWLSAFYLDVVFKTSKHMNKNPEMTCQCVSILKKIVLRGGYYKNQPWLNHTLNVTFGYLHLNWGHWLFLTSVCPILVGEGMHFWVNQSLSPVPLYPFIIFPPPLIVPHFILSSLDPAQSSPAPARTNVHGPTLLSKKPRALGTWWEHGLLWSSVYTHRFQSFPCSNPLRKN